MRAFVEREDPSVKEVDDFMIRRFLRARELDIEKASTLFQKYLSWRRSFIPNGFIAPSEIPNELAQNKFFMQGADKQNRPVVVVFGAKHKPYKGSFEEFKRFVVYTLERICAIMPAGEEKFVSIADLEGWGYSNSDIRGYLAALSILQNFGFRLQAMYVGWQSLSVYCLPESISFPLNFLQIIFVENKKLKSTLLEDIDESQLPDVYGGKLSLVPIQDD
ncbi:hypothetical protein POTOM_014236 [Populus tomentosa]|uniref:CRAL-TRIO domain-containing protein n=1 Tax=Populus tomentosa TaxID=118781 RepID=A0A8X8DA02_POPTO|nr:hypothetical protein POTOM_014236 [Populus tomentosa]